MTLIEQVATYLEDSLSLGTLGTNLFVGYLPSSPDACIAVLDTGGLAPDVDVPTKSPTFQVFIRATNYDNGKAVLDTIRAGLHNKFPSNSTTGILVSGGTPILNMFAIAEGGHLGRDEVGRDLFSINFKCLTR